MTDPRQPGANNNWSSRYPATYNGDRGDTNGYYGANGYASTEVDDLDGLGQDDEIGIARGGANGSSERYWQAPQTLAPDYDDPETQQGLSARDPLPASNGGSSADDATAWWNNSELSARLNDSSADSGAGTAPGTSLGQQPAFEAGPDVRSDWSARLGYDSDATVAASAVPSQAGSEASSSWAGPTRTADPDATVATTYPESEGYSVGSVASAAQSRSESASARSEKANNGPRRARLMLRHIDPLSTLKFTLVLTIALFVVWMVAVGVLYGILNGMGVFEKVNNTINDVNGSDSNVITAQIVFGAAAVIGAVNIVLFTALATVGSFIYNLCADMVGGLELTLAERD